MTGDVPDVPDAAVLRDLGVQPRRGDILAVVFSAAGCAPCDHVRARLTVLGVPVQTVPADSAAVSYVPTVLLVDPAGEVVRAWQGEPLAGTLEKTVRAWRAGRTGL